MHQPRNKYSNRRPPLKQQASPVIPELNVLLNFQSCDKNTTMNKEQLMQSTQCVYKSA